MKVFLYNDLGAEGSFRLYENQYSTNSLALNKNQHNEERERKRHLSHKFSLTPVSEFSWSGVTLGSSSVLLGTLRQNILQLESNIPGPFLHPNWPQHRARWTKLVNAALRPEEFANVLAMLESSLKPVVFNQVWHEALGKTLFTFVSFIHDLSECFLQLTLQITSFFCLSLP